MAGARPFRFGVNLVTPDHRADWAEKCRTAERLGYDVLAVPDHLGAPAPFPALVLAGDVTERPRLATFVLNAAFYNPVLLAREVAGTDQLVDGRLELGIGTGYVREEFDRAGLTYGTAGSRIDRLAEAVTELDRTLGDPEHQPRPIQTPRPPLLLAGNGDRMLRLAARHADVIGFTGAVSDRDGRMSLVDADALQERVEFTRKALGERAGEVELNVLVQTVVITDDRRAVAEGLRTHAPSLTVEQILALPTVLIGRPADIAEQLRENRDRFGFSYVTVLEPAMEAFAPVIELLR